MDIETNTGDQRLSKNLFLFESEEPGHNRNCHRTSQDFTGLQNG